MILGKKTFNRFPFFKLVHNHKSRQELPREYENCRLSESDHVMYVLSKLVPIWLGLN